MFVSFGFCGVLGLWNNCGDWCDDVLLIDWDIVLVFYEYLFNESICMMLCFEYLFDWLG